MKNITMLVFSILLFTVNVSYAGCGDISTAIINPRSYENPIPNLSIPNLQIEELNIHDTPDTKLNDDGTGFMNIGQTYEIHVWPVSKEEDCINGIEQGKDTVEVDTFYKIALNENDSDWKFLHRNYTQCVNMDKDDSKKEIFDFTVPEEARGKRIYFKSKVDSTGEVQETNEHDNWSDVEWYPVQGDCDLVITYARLTGDRTNIFEGDNYGFKMAIKNQGADNCQINTRSAYYHKNPGAISWELVTSDETGAQHLSPGVEWEERTLDDPFTTNILGTHQFMVCADYLHTQPETDENNNCTTSTFNVVAHRPDFIISHISLTGGRTALNLSNRFGLEITVTNQGNATPTADIRSVYYLKAPGQTIWTYVADDGSGASNFCIGCSENEYNMDNPFTASSVGTWQGKACADYQGAVNELDENNNCSSFTFQVNPVGPDFIVSDLYIKVGSTVYREGSTIKKDSYVHPHCTVKNNGNSETQSISRLAYYINSGTYRDSDNVSANLCVGCSTTQNVTVNNIRLGSTGTRTYRCCADYLSNVSELNESNNCATMTFYVK